MLQVIRNYIFKVMHNIFTQNVHHVESVQIMLAQPTIMTIVGGLDHRHLTHGQCFSLTVYVFGAIKWPFQNLCPYLQFKIKKYTNWPRPLMITFRKDMKASQ